MTNKIIKKDPPVIFWPLSSIISFNEVAKANQPLWGKGEVPIIAIMSKANNVINVIDNYALVSANRPKWIFSSTATVQDENKNIRNKQVVRQMQQKNKSVGQLDFHFLR